MILTKTREEIIKYENYTIDYKNGVFCYVEFVNDELVKYNFKKNDKKFEYVEDLTLFTQNLWSEHYKFITNVKFSFDELKNFTRFDKLFYIGCSSDGMVLDINMAPQTSVVNFCSTFSAIYLKIETSKKECENILKTLNSKYIIDSSIYEIPYYNHNEECSEHYTLKLNILLPQDAYVKCIGKETYVNDNVRIKMFEYLKKNRGKKLKRILNEII